ncbi:MAG: MerR family transcriptional regulator, partial [Deltaproteobacteria bacterium]
MEVPARKPRKKDDGYIRKEASKITKIPPRTIQYYTDRGFVTPDVAAPTGRGTTRRYSLKNLVELSFVKELSRHGYTLEKIDGIMRDVRKSLDGYWDKSNDIAWETDLFLILLRPSTKHIGVKLCREEEIDLPQLIIKRSFSVIGLGGVILRILEAAIGTSRLNAYFDLQRRSRYTG